MLVHPFFSNRKGNHLVAESDPQGFVTVKRFKTKSGAKTHASRVGGVVEGTALTRAPITNRGLRIVK